ncbi:Asp-tRNA(Asn)/Glu-tRNA(Gln) amidotransferase subunit GatA [Roseivirga sp. UBA838]|uniref:Asp-tRNA(Asn)/Glu-tRNA(Gln) amidotransferase subunit GatA n=1 Tax=Roseivirga sp. UBA838 TaxID=1947393 RepID=UPI00257AA85A|nr:Asp-tRNA(Asn)/Glu-tRNA(Gln) amidotransferase subunit GatA [Roseivirga sp. UBA838]|tara:strand:+ start:3453 stop:4874 length:1422 start_codon:yes stop_codon:yes gene_type:complete
MKEYHRLDEIQEDLSLGKITCSQLVDYYLTNIERDKQLNAFVEVYAEEAKQRARELDKKIELKTAGPLVGLIFGLKDLICYKDHEVSGASHILKGFESQFSATAVERLLQQDAILIGRQNCDEFGMGSSNENSAHGPAKNPVDPARVPGGSSGGSAAAVAANMCHVALGTDTGGSVRQPAAFCGIYGLKPTYSRISRWGLLAYASSFDTIGIFSRSVEDNARILEAIAGRDEKDATSSSRQVAQYSNAQPHGTYRIAYFPELFDHNGLQPEIQEAYKNWVRELEKDGHSLVEESFPFAEYILPTYYILTTAEASTNLARYDGAHYGLRSGTSNDLEAMYKNSRTEGFGDEVRRRIMLGTFVLSADYYDAYFTQAQKLRRLIKEATEAILQKVDFIITPTTPTTAFEHKSHASPLAMYMADLFTVQASICGLPAISVPMGNDAKNLPIGMQIMGAAFEEEKLFAFSKIQQNNSR